ncbi:hypothetical protein [Malonomonas rubra]|nr:hypothetical protein [Malonomonas rubra]
MNARLKQMWLGALAIFLSGVFASSVLAAGPWNYDRQLPDRKAGVKIDLATALYVDFDKQRYYLVDAQGGQLVSFDNTGKFLAAFNAGGELKTPISLARSQKGVLWVVDRADNRLLQINPRLQKVQRFRVKYPDGSWVRLGKIAIDPKNRIFVLDQLRGSVLELDDDLSVKRQFRGGEAFAGFVDFKLKSDGIWALDGRKAQIYHFDNSGVASAPVSVSGLEFPVSLEVDSAGRFYVLDRHAGIVAVYGPAGDKRFEFLGKGKRPGQLWFPEELVFDWDERLCVVDEGNGRVDILTR